MQNQSTGKFLAALRKAQGYTQSEVAEKLNISDKTLSSWETDRTLPDLLLLPTIADLYGVSVDEILRGERITKTEHGETSEKALQPSRKGHYEKFVAQSTLLYGIAIISALVLLLTSVILPFTASPLWLNILFCVLGGICIAVCLLIMFCLEYRLRIKEGIIIRDDFSSENKAFILGAKRKITDLSLIFALIVSIAIFVLLWEFAFLDFDTLPLILLIVYSVIFIALILFALLYCKINVSTYGTEEQTDILKANVKFAKKVYGISAIPAFAVLVILFILWLALSSSSTPYFESSDFNEFRNHTQTLHIMEGSTENVHYDYKPGDYQLDFPENPQLNVYYKLNESGNGIYGKKTTAENGWALYFKYKDEYKDIGTVLIMKLNGKSFVNVRYARFYDFRLNYTCDYYEYANVKITINDKFYGEQEIDEHFKYEDGKYGFYSDVYRDFGGFFLIITVISLCAVYITVTAVYFTKRKKIKYEY